MYSYEEVLNASTEYFGGDDLAAKVLVDKYCLRNEKDEFLEKTPDDMFLRIAKELHRIDKTKFSQSISVKEFLADLDGFKRIVLQGGPMFGIGNQHQYVSLGNCFTLPPPEDSYSGITYTDAQITQISCRRGGVGWDISNLRPSGMAVKNAAKSTTGAISFAKRFSNTIREIAQNGRRAASLQSISCYHPEVLDFIHAKRDLNQLTGSNISIQFKDSFMRAVTDDAEVELRWPINGKAKTKTVVRARSIWDEFVSAAHHMAEPGCQFIDTVHKMSTGVPYGHVETTSNPCGEQYLPPYASCRLLLLNLTGYVQNAYTDTAIFDFELFKKDVARLVRIGDNLVDLEIECIDRILSKIESDPEQQCIKQIALDLWAHVKRVAIEDRRMGCGFNALGDALASLGIKYDSDEAVEFAERMQRTFALEAYRASVDLAKQLGSFPLFEQELDKRSGFVKLIKKEDPELFAEMQKYGRRNMVLMTVAPSGSVSCLTRTTSGLEPVFKIKYTRRKKGNPGDKEFRVDFVDQNGDSWMHFEVEHPGFKRWKEVNPDKRDEESPYHGQTANDIHWQRRIDVQAALQKWTDNSLSITINLPEDTTTEVVSNIYLEAWKRGCKGVTIYRENCRTGVLVDSKKPGICHTKAIKRPDDLPCDVHHISVKGQSYFVMVGLLNSEPYEIFAGKNGYIAPSVSKGVLHKVKRPKCYKAVLEDDTVIQPVTMSCSDQEEAVTRLVSTSLRHGANIQYIVEQLQKTQGDMNSFSRALARALKKYVPDGTATKEKCAACGGSLAYQEGCLSCRDCQYSKCS